MTQTETYFIWNPETQDYDITPTGIKFQAQNFWCDQEFYHICCDNDDEDNPYCSFEFVGIDEDENLVIYNSCANRAGPSHNYYIKLFKERDGGQWFSMSPYNPLEHSQTPEIMEADLLRNPGAFSPLTQTEIAFWTEVSKLYPTIPEWMIEFNLLDDDNLPWGFDEDEIDEDEVGEQFYSDENIEMWLDDLTEKLYENDLRLEEEYIKQESESEDSYISPFDGEHK